MAQDHGNVVAIRGHRDPRHTASQTEQRREKLTAKIVRDLPVPAKGNKITYDGEVKGFGIRVTAAGARSFVLNYRRRSDGLERRYTIGSFPEWSVDGARKQAQRLKRQVDDDGDPLGKETE